MYKSRCGVHRLVVTWSLTGIVPVFWQYVMGKVADSSGESANEPCDTLVARQKLVTELEIGCYTVAVAKIAFCVSRSPG